MTLINPHPMCEDDTPQELRCPWLNTDSFNFTCDSCLQRHRWTLCLDCDAVTVYHGKNEKDIPAGRQNTVEEILWCVIHTMLEGHQSTGQAKQCPLFLKCHQGWEHSFLLDPDQVSRVLGMEWSAKQEQASDDHLFMDVTSS